MHKYILTVVGITILIVCVSLSGCNENLSKKNDTNKFIGTWEGISYYLNITSNVTLTFYDVTVKQVDDETHTHTFIYEVDDNCLYLRLLALGRADIAPNCYYYEFSNNDYTLTLTNESFDTLVLTKQ